MLKILLFDELSYNFDFISFSTPKTTPSLPLIPIAVLQIQEGSVEKILTHGISANFKVLLSCYRSYRVWAVIKYNYGKYVA